MKISTLRRSAGGARPPRATWIAAALILGLCAGPAFPQAPAAHREEPAAQRVEIENPKLFKKSARAAMAALSFYGVPNTAEMDDPEEARRLERERQRVIDIGYQLAAHARYGDFPFSFFLIDMPVPNAFALPGGHIFVTRGMLDLGLDDDMLACLLAHEIAHVVFEHGTRMQRRATLLNVLSQAALIGVMIGADSEPENTRDPYGIERTGDRKGSLVQGTAAAGIVFTELLLRKYSRGFEDQADAEGQRLAAAAGFDPDGARALWQLMTERIPTANEYGYWRTHPFSDQRLRAAEVRARELKIREPGPVFAYRRATQVALLGAGDELDEDEALAKRDERDDRNGLDEPTPQTLQPWEEGLLPFLESSALDAWPTGEDAERIRIEQLHRRRDRLMEAPEMARDYGSLLRAYDKQIATVRALDPRSGALEALEGERDAIVAQVDALLPRALEIWRDGIFQTPFLEKFLSNFPDSELAPKVALALGDAYSRSRREADAVEQYLRAFKAGADAEAGRRALLGLRNLAPYLDQLAALQMLADDIDDDEVGRLASQRLGEQASRFENLENGSDYLERYPKGLHREAVTSRLEKLAQNLYGEVVLYQNLGDHVKALERIQKILEHAPMTPAAESLRQKAVLDS
ncbi:MAG: M48 family metalloprotease [Acidobacteriota bacterium]